MTKLMLFFFAAAFGFISIESGLNGAYYMSFLSGAISLLSGFGVYHLRNRNRFHNY